MARAQDAPTQVGGQIDPYVQQSIGQGKQQAENRLLSAMQQAGATARTSMQEAGASERTAMNVAGQRQMQAANLAAQDRRAAEQEKARRETQKWNATQSDITRRLEKEIEDNRLEWDKAKFQQDVDRMKELDATAMDIMKLRMAARKHESDVQRNVMLKQMDMLGQKMTADEKKRTYFEEQRKLAEERDAIYENTKSRVSEKLDADMRVAFKPGANTQPVETLNQTYQEALSGEKSNITAEDLQSPGLTTLKMKAMKNELSAEDFRAFWAVTDAFTEGLQDRADAATSEIERKYWLHAKSEMLNNKTKIMQYMDNDTSVGNTSKTFGQLIRDGIWDLEGLSAGKSYMSALAEGKTWEDYMGELQASIEPFSMPEIELNTSKGRGLDAFIRELYTEQTGGSL